MLVATKTLLKRKYILSFSDDEGTHQTIWQIFQLNLTYLQEEVFRITFDLLNALENKTSLFVMIK